MHRFLFADTETTGLEFHKGDRLVEVALVEYVNRQPTGRTYHQYINPQRPVDPDAFRVHGLSDDFLAKQPTFERIADDLVKFIDGAELVIHNAEFDLTFLNGELARIGRPPLPCECVLDTLELVRAMEPGRRATLDAMADRHGVDRSHRKTHGALLDAELLAEVYIRMSRVQSSLGIDEPGAEERVAAVGDHKLNVSHLVVIRPSLDELRAHDGYIEALAKETKGACLWTAYDERERTSTLRTTIISNGLDGPDAPSQDSAPGSRSNLQMPNQMPHPAQTSDSTTTPARQSARPR